MQFNAPMSSFDEKLLKNRPREKYPIIFSILAKFPFGRTPLNRVVYYAVLFSKTVFFFFWYAVYVTNGMPKSVKSITPKYARNLLKVINHNLQKTTCAKLAKWEYVCLSKHCWCSPEKIDIFHLRFFHTKNSNCINIKHLSN